jgi:hypothetical protein
VRAIGVLAEVFGSGFSSSSSYCRQASFTLPKGEKGSVVLATCFGVQFR